MSSTVFLVVLLLHSVIMVCAYTDWSYRDPDGHPSDWTRSYPECGGQRQSPIRLDDFTTTNKGLGFELIRGYKRLPTAMKLTNNGLTLFLTGEGQQPRLLFDDGKIFQLFHIHFHWGTTNSGGSEHVFKDLRYALESQAIHFRIDQNGAQVTPAETIILVQFYQYFEGRRSHTGLDDIVDYLEDVDEMGMSVAIKPFMWDLLISVQDNNFYRYDGSLTTPPCTEGVTFIVTGDIKYVDKKQIRAFRKLRGRYNQTMSGNIRPLQERNGRKVFHCKG